MSFNPSFTAADDENLKVVESNKMLEQSSDEFNPEEGQKKRRLNAPALGELQALHQELLQAIDMMKNEQLNNPKDILHLCQELWDEVSFLKLELKSIHENLLTVEQARAIVEKEKQEQKTAFLETEYQLKSKCEELESKCQQLSDELISVEEALLDDMARLNSENENLKSKLKASNCISSGKCLNCAQTESQLLELSQSMDLLEQCLSRVPMQSDICMMEINYQKEIDRLIVEKGKLENEIVKKDTELAARESDFKDIMETLAQAQRSERSNCVNYENTILENELALKVLKSKVESLNLELVQNHESVEQLHAQLASVKTEKLEMSSTLDQKLACMKDLKNENISLRKEINSIKSAIDSGNAKELEFLRTIAELQKNIIILTSEVESMRSEESSWQSSKSTLEQLNQALSVQIAVEKQTISSLRAELSSINESMGATTDMQTRSSDQINQLQNQLSLQNAHIEELTHTNERLEADLGKVAEFWKNQVSSLQNDHVSEISMFRKEHSELTSSINVLRDQNNALTSRIVLLNESIDESKSEKERCSQLLERCNNQKNELQEQKLSTAVQTESIKPVESKQTEILLRIELEKLKETYAKDKRRLNLRIHELEESCMKSNSNEDCNVNDLAKIKRLEEENFRLSQLHQACQHKLEYYASLLKSKSSTADRKENLQHNDQAFGR